MARRTRSRVDVRKAGCWVKVFDTPSLVSSPCASTLNPLDCRSRLPIRRFPHELARQAPTKGAGEPKLGRHYPPPTTRLNR